MDRTVCSHNNRPSECQQCEDEIPAFLRGVHIERGKEIAALEDRVRELEAENARLREAYESETQRLTARIQTLEAFCAGGIWRWMGTEEDDIESLTCPILISADDMRAALKG